MMTRRDYARNICYHPDLQKPIDRCPDCGGTFRFMRDGIHLDCDCGETPPPGKESSPSSR